MHYLNHLNSALIKGLLAAGCLLPCLAGRTQFLMDVVDTSNRFQISGYVQPQFQYALKEGATGYSGGDFPQHVNNRLTLRRGRIRFDYTRVYEDNHPFLQVVLQFDGTERGVFIRDFWTRVFENKWNVFSLTTGMFARPFGYEVNLGSADRESPERGRMSQILMKVERDLGAMVSFSPRRQNHPLHNLAVDAGLFNGQGLTAVSDFDSYKDFIARAYLRALQAGKIRLSGGISYFNGGYLNTTGHVYTLHGTSAGKIFRLDSAAGHGGRKLPRTYYGADAQLRWQHGTGYTELRGEYWQGKQSASLHSSETPFILPAEPSYIRNFNGAFFYLLHSFNRHHQLGVKYDWYDPNARVSGNEIGVPGANISEANIRFNTLGFGYTNYVNNNLKVVCWYELIRNEKTALQGYVKDVDDDVFTLRLQYRF